MELRVDFVYAGRALIVPNAPNASTDTITSRFYRTLMVATLGTSITENIAIGIGAGGVVGGPFYDSNGLGFLANGRRFNGPNLTALAYGRYRLGRDFSIEGRAALVIDEKQPAYSTDFEGGVYEQTGRLTSAILSLGLRGDLASGPGPFRTK